MQYFKSQNLWLPNSDDFNLLQAKKEFAIKNRLTDLASWGILHANSYPASVDIPVSSINEAPNLRQIIGEFTLQLDTQNGLLSVGAGSNSALNPPIIGGVAYDLNGERLAITQDAAFNFSTSIPQGQQSTGNLSIPLTLTGTIGGSSSNTSQFGTYYFWIEYLAANDPAYPSTLKNGTIIYPSILDGYRIRITGTPVSPSGDGISVFLCKVIWAAVYPETINLTAGEVIRSNGNVLSTIPTAVAGEPHRVYASIRQQAVEAIPDATLRPANYATGVRATAQDHFCGVGTGVITPFNTHGLSISDLTGGSNNEPIAQANANNMLAAGFVDLGIAQNSPRSQSTCAQPSIQQNTLTPSNLSASTIAGSGIDSAVQSSWIRVGTMLAPLQTAYLNGLQLQRLYPSVRETSDHTADSSINPLVPNTGDGWIGFSNEVGNVDPVGTYRLLGQVAVWNGQNVLLLTKQLLTGYPTSIPAVAPGTVAIGQVYWNGTDIFRDYLQAQNPANPAEDIPIDLRTIGLVGPQQLSTYLKDKALSAQTFQNLIGNSNFLFYVSGNVSSGTQFPGWNIVPSTYLPYAGVGQLSYVTDPLLVTGPGALQGAILTTVGSISSGTTQLYAQLAWLKPNTNYAISFWYRADTAWTGRLRVGIQNGNSGSSSSVITTGSPYPLPQDVSILNDPSTYHRATMVVTTGSAVTPADIYYLLFQVDATAAATASLRIANVQITEGEWTPGYNASPGSTIPQNGIFLWDATSSCPAGSSEVTAAAGTIPLIRNSAGGSSVQTPGVAAGTPITNSAQIGGHFHTTNIGNQGSNGGSGYYQVPDPQTTTTVDVPIPTYIMLLCRVL